MIARVALRTLLLTGVAVLAAALTGSTTETAGELNITHVGGEATADSLRYEIPPEASDPDDMRTWRDGLTLVDSLEPIAAQDAGLLPRTPLAVAYGRRVVRLARRQAEAEDVIRDHARYLDIPASRISAVRAMNDPSTAA